MLPTRHMLRVSAFRLAVSLLVGVPVGACERLTARDQPDPSPSAPLSSAVLLPSARPARPIGSEALAVSRLVQATKLQVPPAREHAPRLAFGRGVLGQLTDHALLVYDTATFELLATHPLEHPRVLLALADGALLAIGASRMLRFEPANRRATPLQRPPLLPRASSQLAAGEPSTPRRRLIRRAPRYPRATWRPDAASPPRGAGARACEEA